MTSPIGDRRHRAVRDICRDLPTPGGTDKREEYPKAFVDALTHSGILPP